MNDYGAQFVKKIRPIGAAIVLLMGVLITITLFTVDLGVPPRHYPMHETEYYLQSVETMEKLKSELIEYVFPAFASAKIITEIVQLPDNTLRLGVFVERDYLGRVRAVLERDFDPLLFVFEVLHLG